MASATHFIVTSHHLHQVGEAYIFLIATAVKEVWAPVEAMLEVAAYPDFNIAAISFNFWSKLSRQVRGMVVRVCRRLR